MEQTEKIKSNLREIERLKRIKILYACETGSRAWGFPSPDSDYDVRFIYMHDRDWYLALGRKKDTIEVPIADDFDITGWDLRKGLTLLKKSNAPLIERFQSPIEYYSAGDFKSDFLKLINAYYSPTAVFYHHYSLAKKFWEEIKDQKQVKLKNYFYLLRSLLSCNWIVHDKTVLPMHIAGLMEKIEPAVRNRIDELILLKSGVGEKYSHPEEQELNQWIAAKWVFIDGSKDSLGVNNADYSLLDQFFLKALYGKVDN